MGFTEILTGLFIILKLTHTIDWSWWLVLLPEIIAAGIYVLSLVGIVTGVLAIGSKARKR